MAAFGKGVDALSIASPVLKSGPSAYETTIARMGIEGDQAKLAAAQDAAAKEAAAKQKEVTTKNATIDPGTVFAPHTMMYLKKRKDAQDWIQGYLEKSGGEAPPVDSPEYGQWEAIKLGLKQFESNSKQAEADYNVMAKLIAEDAKSGNPRFRKDAPSKLNEIYSNPDLPDKGLLPERITGLYDLEGQIASTFGKIAKEQEAWASQDGTRSGTKEYIPSDAFLTVAETFATDPYAAAELQERFKSYTPEKQKWIMDYAEKLGTNSDVAMAVDMATGLYDRVRKTAQSEQQNEAGYGKAVDEAGAINFIEKGIGMNDPSNKGRTLKDIGLVDVGTITDFLNNNPQLQRFSVDIPKNAEIFNGYNGMVYETKEADGKRINRYVAGIVREPNTGNTQLITVDGTGGTPKVSKPIPSEKFYTEVMDPLAVNSEELDHKKVGYVFQKNYSPIYKQEGNVKLPTKGGAWDLNEAGELE